MKTTAAMTAGLILGAAGILGAQGPATSVAFVDINRVFQSYAKVKSVDTDIAQEADKLKAAFNQRKQDLEKSAGDIDVKFDPGTKEWISARREVELALAGLQFDAKAASDNLVRKKVAAMASLYKEICAVAQRVAEEKGYSCVFNIDTDPIKTEDHGQSLGLSDLKAQMAFRTGVWASPDHDLSKDVLEALEKAK